MELLGKICTLNRLQTNIIESEMKSIENLNAINFSVNKFLSIAGIGAFGGKGENSITLELFEAKIPEQKLGSTRHQWYKENNDSEIEKIYFETPIQLKIGIIYT